VNPLHGYEYVLTLSINIFAKQKHIKNQHLGRKPPDGEVRNTLISPLNRGAALETRIQSNSFLFVLLNLVRIHFSSSVGQHTCKMIFSRRFSHPCLTCTVVFILSIFLITWEFNSRRLHPLFLSLSAPTPPDHPRWLLAIFLPPERIVRRAVIRSTWATRYPNPFYECRFIIGGYRSSPWATLIAAENATHGDILALENFVPDDQTTANHIKAMELFNYLVRQQRTSGRRYDFVSKVDDDNWFNIPPFYNTFIASRLPGGEKHKPNALTVIGRPMSWGKPFAYTSGRMYTVSWPTLELLAGKYAADPGFDFEGAHLAEDMLPEYFLYTDKIEHEFVPVELEQAWDIGLEYLVNNETMLIHGIKQDERMLDISTMFDERGRWNGKLINGLTNFNRTMKEVVERLGEVSEEEMEQLRSGWESWSSSGAEGGGYRGDPKDTLDWKLIREKIHIENREALGQLFPMSLPGNNDSSRET